VNKYTSHIASFIPRLLLAAVVLVYSHTTASADNAKKAMASKQKAAPSAVLPMASGTVYASVKAVASRSKALAKTTGKLNAGNDSTGRDNRILFARASGDVFTSRIELAREEPLIEIGIYNMLGKRVMDVYKGASGRGQQEFTQSLAELPDGVYICILQGDNFRKAEKFYFRR
jgi:hypothetical protein